ncbi:MAG: hypothetical protein JWR67_2029 [Mucilaginibacter sp.]|nr:hypothetical protein [Mucilaginibacter sp.]
MYDTFTTNSGVCFLFETIKRDVIFLTSDIKVMHNEVFSGDSELFDGRIVKLNGIEYKIIKISTYSDLQRGSDYYDNQFTGVKYQYSHVLRMFVEKL